MKYLVIKASFLTFFLSQLNALFSQPVWFNDQSKESINDFTIASDARDKYKYYYLPSSLDIACDLDGKPKIKLLSVKYQPQDQDTKVKFLNILEFTVIPKYPNDSLIASFKKRFLDKIVVVPAVLDHIDLDLRIPSAILHNETKSKNVGESTLHNYSNIESQWSERTFTINLIESEAQLIKEILNRQSLGISLGYKIYASGLSIKTKSADILSGAIMKQDTTRQSFLVANDAIAIHPDLGRWPDIIALSDYVDILPARFAILNIACFDCGVLTAKGRITKKLTLRAIADNNQPMDVQEVYFEGLEREGKIKSIQFPLPLNISKPIKYQIEETNETGYLIKDNYWRQTYFSNGMLDITSTENSNITVKSDLEIILNFGNRNKSEITNLILILEYKLLKVPQSMALSFGETQSLFLSIWRDKNSNIKMYPKYSAGGKKYVGKTILKSPDGFYMVTL